MDGWRGGYLLEVSFSYEIWRRASSRSNESNGDLKIEKHPSSWGLPCGVCDALCVGGCGYFEKV